MNKNKYNLKTFPTTLVWFREDYWSNNERVLVVGVFCTGILLANSRTIEWDRLNSNGFKYQLSFDNGLTWYYVNGLLDPDKYCGINGIAWDQIQNKLMSVG